MSDPVEPFYEGTSPTPWTYKKDEDGEEIIDANGEVVMGAYDPYDEQVPAQNDMQMIVDAVNQYIDSLIRLDRVTSAFAEVMARGTGKPARHITDIKETQK